MSEVDVGAEEGPPVASSADVAPSAAPAEVATEPEDDGRSFRNVVEWVAIVVGALAVALLVKTFLIQAFFIPSLSMFPTLDEGDRVLVNKLSYQLHDINRGDIVVFERPKGQPKTEIKDLIKRVIALPGETIEAREGVVYIDGQALDEPYLVEGVTTDNLPKQVIPAGHVWVMGDNRGDSSDSRVFGAIDEDSVVGRAFIRVWPITKINLM